MLLGFNDNYNLIHYTFLFIINVGALGLSFWVYLAGRQKIENRFFLLLTIFLLFWIDGGYLFSILKDFTQALFLGRLILGMVCLFLISLYFFLKYFPIKDKKEQKTIDTIILLSGFIIFFVTIFTNFVVRNVELTQWGNNPIYHPIGRIIFYGTIIIIAILILFKLFLKYSYLTKNEKIKVQYFLIGLSIFIVINLFFNVALPLWRGTIQYWQFGNYSAIFLIGFTAYAIVKRELFGIKVILTEVLVGVIAILLLVQVLVSESLLEYLWKGGLFVLFLIFGYFLIQSVIREIKRRAELQKLYEQVNRLSKTKSEFISIASHQLRTPLTAIKGYISMMLEKTYGKLPPKMKKPLENIYISNERLIKLVNDLLNVSRIEAGRMKLKLEKASIEEIISSVIEELENEAKNKKIYLKFSKPLKKLPKISIDKDKFRQVVMNVIDNAIRYTEKGGITVKAKDLKSKIQIIISDTGAGLTKDELSKMFESFSRGTAGTQLYTEGVGLGLYVAKKFTEMHRGKIWAESEGKGKGSTFYIELPIK